MLNPAHLDLFRAVLQHGGITRAATALGIGQPHVSRTIVQLETELGFPLLVRGHGSASPTPEGEAFAREVERTYAGLDHLRQAAREIRELGAGPVRVASQPSLAIGLVPKAVRRLSAELPGARVTLHVPSPDTIWSWVASGQCDVGLVRPRSGHAGVACESFLTVDAVCVMPHRHRLSGKRTISLSDLAGEPLIAGAPGVFQQAIEDAFIRHDILPRFVFMAQYTQARCALAAEGLGLAIVDPVALRPAAERVVVRRLVPRLPIETLLIRCAGKPVSLLVARFVELLREERDASWPVA